jgi:hypothetical protein
MIPRSLGRDKNMHVDLNARVAVNGSQRYAVHFPCVSSAKRRATGAAETKAPSRRGLIPRKILGATCPGEGMRHHFGISRSCAAKCLSTARTVATPGVAKGRLDQVADSTAKTTSRQSHEQILRQCREPSIPRKDGLIIAHSLNRHRRARVCGSRRPIIAFADRVHGWPAASHDASEMHRVIAFLRERDTNRPSGDFLARSS